jgi:DNA polymerase II large subunit
MRDLKTLLHPDDAMILNATQSVNWVPKDPASVLLPYVEENPKDDITSLEYRRKKAKEVMDGYSNIIEECKKMEATIEDRCKNTVIELSDKTNLRVMEALTRVFGVKTSTITFEQYKQCIKALAEINNQLPTPGK